MEHSRRFAWPSLLAFAALAIGAQAEAQTGKCCLPDGRGCRDVTQDQCDNAGGVFLAGQMCASPDDTCDGPITGACCRLTGCVVVTSGECPGPEPFFPNAACSPTVCPPPATGACCRSGVCAITIREDCIGSGGEWYQEQTCTPQLCRLGGCCTSPLSCVIVSESGCEQGFWIADGTCVTFFCVQARGTCCRSDGTCVVTTDTDCTNGTFVFEAVCTGGTCQSVTGACCRDTACTVSPAADCTGAFQGAGTACGATDNPTTCCPANFNSAAGITVQDIFDYLAAYFAGDVRADFNGAGGVTVQDIFDFLAAYFAGCE
jgi:hypothetical protein